VTLQWKSMLYTGPFRQSVTIFTNDPQRPEVKLRVAGRFSAPVEVVPRELVFSRVPFGQAATGQVRMVSYLDDPLKILSCELADSPGAEHFAVTWVPLAAAQLAVETGVRTGYLVRVTARPSLAPGSFQQCVVIRTNLKSVPQVEIPVLGLVGSDIAIVGRGWNAQTGVLTLGTVDSRTVLQWPLAIIIRGPYARNVKFKSVQTFPKLLQVKLGDTVVLGRPALSRTPLTVEIPKGSSPARHLGSDQGQLGQIKLETSHPEAPELRILVRFAVAG
jgi:hypothetical protein